MQAYHLTCLAEAESPKADSPKGEANFWSALPSMLWVLLILIAFLTLRRVLLELLRQLVLRVQTGVSVKIGSVEIGAVRTEQHHHPSAALVESCQPEGAAAAGEPVSLEAVELNYARQQYRTNSRGVMLVHRLFRSSRPGQLYDVLIYLVPYHDASLAEVAKVEYFFGRYWKNQVYSPDDRSRGFPILTSAYGTFLCCARVTFTGGQREFLFRYIDFEMGAYAPLLAQPERAGGSDDE